MKKLILAALILTMAQTANAVVTSSTDTQYYYSSYPMPKANWRTTAAKTKIASKSFGNWQYVVAVPFYYYGNNINNDIIKLRAYLTSKRIPYRDGICTTFPYTAPCLR